MTREMHMGDIVRHFKRETVANPTTEYLYKILAFAEHTETGEKLVDKYMRMGYAMFMSEVDREKYPAIKQKYRFEVVQEF